MRGATHTTGDSSLVPLLVLLLIIGACVWFGVYWKHLGRERWERRGREHLIPLSKHVARDIVALVQIALLPLRRRRVKGPSDEDLKRFFEDPPKYRPDEEHVSKVKQNTIPCIICGTPIPHGGRYCKRCEGL